MIYHISYLIDFFPLLINVARLQGGVERGGSVCCVRGG